MKRYGLSAGLSVVAVLSATMASAQPTKRFVLTPYAGMYAPTTNLVAMSDLNAKHKSALALGLNASYWVSERTAIEFGGAYAFSDAKATGTDLSTSFQSTENAYVLMGTVKAMVALLPPESNASLRLGFGPAIITRGGNAYKEDAGKITGRTDLGGAISLCSKIPITDAFAIRLRAEDYLYQAQLSYRDNVNPSDDIRYDKKFQSDLLFSAGLQFAFFR